MVKQAADEPPAFFAALAACGEAAEGGEAEDDQIGLQGIAEAASQEPAVNVPLAAGAAGPAEHVAAAVWVWIAGGIPGELSFA